MDDRTLLGTRHCDFQETFHQIHVGSRTDRHGRAAGVLLPLLYRVASPGGKGQFVFQLIKRSSLVPQPGDLSFPGGMLHPLLDRLLRPLLIHGPFPILGGKARGYALQNNAPAFPSIALFLTNALRESWEEIRLSPARVRFLGPLPAYNLTLFRRTIFPLAGFVENPVLPRPNREVEKIVEIPLSSFYDEEHFGCYQITAPDSAGHRLLQYPCLIHRDSDGADEVLWGATFHIIISFLGIVMDYRLPEWRDGPVIARNLRPDYLTGRSRS
ncbi:MAG: CoA pyrophosphatase [Deltaproteobacteria bacterium]|nr:CoA pyrophosphatase [Deltaproteobacteria bacterium]